MTNNSLTDFYAVRDWQQEGETASCTIAFNPGHSIFAGHFPGQPVVPGVCSMAIVRELAERMKGKPLLIRSTGQVKFLRLLTPELQTTVQISCKPTDDGFLLQSVWKVDGADVFKMTATLAEIPYGSTNLQ